MICTDWMPSPAELLERDHLARKFDEVNAPLYISYPTLGFWKESMTGAMVESVIGGCRDPFVYVHVPFCENVCSYCMCYKLPAAAAEVRTRYVEALSKEIETKTALLPANGKAVSQIHIGGGTPTCLEERDLELLASRIANAFVCDQSDGCTFSIEAFPRRNEITVGKLRILRSLGFNEISFGVQDLDQGVQRAINRSSTPEDVAWCVEAAKSEGFRVHIDLCYGLPFQELGSFERTIRTVISMNPDRVAMLTYVHFPLLYANQRTIPVGALPNSFMRTLLWQCADSVFTSEGYSRIGIDHFVRDSDPLLASFNAGKVRRDLMGYSAAERRNVLGFGSTAISFVDGTYWHNPMTAEEYVDVALRRELPLASGGAYTLTRDDQIRSEVILTYLLTRCAIDVKEIEDRFTIDFREYFDEEYRMLERCRIDGLVDFEADGRIVVTESGRCFCRHIAALFDKFHRKRKPS